MYSGDGPNERAVSAVHALQDWRGCETMKRAMQEFKGLLKPFCKFFRRQSTTAWKYKRQNDNQHVGRRTNGG